MATDPRVAVRGGAAYGGTKIPFLEVAEDIRTAAYEIDKALSTDPYAMIQRVFGGIDGRLPRS
jgi:hypothetical protein